MSHLGLTRFNEKTPFLFDDIIKPWNDWFNDIGPWGKTLTVPAVNIVEDKERFNVSLAVPGMKKEDLKIDLDGNMLAISCENVEKKEEKDEKFTRREYNFSSFKRSFTLPEEVDKEKIEARYEDGVLKLMLPKKEELKKISASKNIAVQ
ncbi:MAG: Hsp20/alpha crystallin family protein [Bacteroidetes bacterium]|nr:Hsp20/alpha crystallin family protein [Bacteroidota bacterium]